MRGHAGRTAAAGGPGGRRAPFSAELTAPEPALAPARPVTPSRQRERAVSHGFADIYLTGATLIALAPAFLVAVGVVAPRLGLMSEGVGIGLLAMQWAPHIALASVAAGAFGVLVALLAGFSRFWLRALLVLAITTTTLFAYVWEREVRQPAAAVADAG
ncbi:MAG: hypothetical protein C0481_19630 [Phenylobacterium sp.]|uniref:hypothetical protein n=1 Tax=Phenylobacterium sp. TaxID=1871053 RepID=UPI0025EA3E52|nr:hypothetical protein [Phenylobacterium sp.]MBA4014079.1 hypothetical protein [Phenylobacterium sp.]